MATKWLVTGAAGMLGQDLLATLATERADDTVTAVDLPELDITDLSAVRAAVAGHDIVVNVAAWTNVDAAESNEAAATLVNGTAVDNIATACAESGARLLHVSTDYVLAGNATSPYPEDAQPAPVNAYGRSKLVGEQAVLRLLPEHGYIVRTAWLYGRNGKNFVSTMLRLARERDFVEVVTDQQGQPTWTCALAAQLVALGDAAIRGVAPAGIYHGTASGQTTWFEFARSIFEAAGHDPQRVHETTSGQFASPAARPAYSVLGHDRWALAGMQPMADWRSMLAKAMATSFAE